MKPNKTAKVAERVDAKFAQRLQTVADKVGVPKAQLVRCALLAVVEHAERNDYSLSFPLRISSVTLPMPGTNTHETKEWVLGKLRKTIESGIRSGLDKDGPVTNYEEFQARVTLRMREAEARYDQAEAHRRQLLPSAKPGPVFPSGSSPHHAEGTVHP